MTNHGPTELLSAVVRCWWCEGRGNVSTGDGGDIPGWKSCRACGASGVIRLEKAADMACPDCFGHGRMTPIWGNHTDCPNCKGTGRVKLEGVGE